MKAIIPGVWNVCIGAETVEAIDNKAAIWAVTKFVNQAAQKLGLFVTAEEIKS